MCSKRLRRIATITPTPFLLLSYWICLLLLLLLSLLCLFCRPRRSTTRGCSGNFTFFFFFSLFAYLETNRHKRKRTVTVCFYLITTCGRNGAQSFPLLPIRQRRRRERKKSEINSHRLHFNRHRRCKKAKTYRLLSMYSRGGGG